jgi:endonuclease/exonuclease/phosphatase family metal-dependent hydrolase
MLLVWAMACLSCYISPVHSWFLSFLGLGFPLVMVGLIAFLVLWLLWRRRIFWVNLIAFLVSIPFILSWVTYHPAGTRSGIKVMSYNVRNFDLYNWSGNRQTRSKIMTLLAREHPDVLCLQEFYTDDLGFNNAAYIRDTLGYRYSAIETHFDKYYKPKAKGKTHYLQWGTAIFSRYPIIDSGSVGIHADGTNRCQYADLQINAQTLRVYNAHLQSVHLDYEDYDTIDELTENQNTNGYRIRLLIGKLRRAFGKRAKQAEIVHEHIANCKGSKILCGDLNDCPMSYTYHTIAAGMQDAFVNQGRGVGRTYIHRLGFFRIDYVLTGMASHIAAYEVLPDELSDHYPIVAWVKL